MLLSPQLKKIRRQQRKSAANNDFNNPDWSPFRVAEKRFKARFPIPDLSNVLDLAILDPARALEIQQGFWSGRSDAIAHHAMHLQGRRTKGYIIPRIPGAAFSAHIILISICLSIRACYSACIRPSRTTKGACEMVSC
jgi:hypothetical protein